MTNPPPPPPPPSSSPAARAGANPPAPTKLVIAPRTIQPKGDRIVLYAVEGWGKTTLASQTPSPLILMSRGEDGYDTLLRNSRVQSVPAIEVKTWTELLQTLDQLNADTQGVQTLILDAMSGYEKMCHEYVCTTEFSGDWGEKGFAAFGRGYKLAAVEWNKMLQKLDRMREHGVTILFLGHSLIKTFNNPIGADFDRYVSDCHERTWSATKHWADQIAFGNFLTVFRNEKEAERTDRGKATAGQDRVVYCSRCDAYDAKNRLGWPERIYLSNNPDENWTLFTKHVA